MLSFIFSGQGSHYYAMGRDLYEHNEVFANAINRYSRFYQEITGINLVDHLYHLKHQNPFNDVLVTHPAIVIVELAMLDVMNHHDIKPDCVIGSSVGELAALVAADMMDRESAITAAFQQALAISHYAPTGGMSAVISERIPALDHLIAKYDLYLAGDNFPGHFTVSGLEENLTQFEKELISLSISFQRLEIRFAFHSPLIDSARHAFLNQCQHLQIRPPKAGVRYFSPSIDGFITSPKGADYLWQAIRSYSDLNHSLLTLMNTLGGAQFIDLGPSGTMATFINNSPQLKSLFPHLKVNSILSRFRGDENRLSAVIKRELIPG